MKTKRTKKNPLITSVYNTFFSNIPVNIMDTPKISTEIENILSSLPQPPNLATGTEYLKIEMEKVVAKYRQDN